VLAWDNGKPIPPDRCVYNFKRIIKRHDLKKVTRHDLRHTYAPFFCTADRSRILPSAATWVTQTQRPTKGSTPMKSGTATGSLQTTWTSWSD